MITYVDPRQLHHLTPFHEYKNTLHICATKNLRDALVERFQNKEQFITAPIVTAISVLEIIFKGWNESVSKLEQYLHLSDIIRAITGIEEEYASAFRRNQIDILDTIRLMEISGVSPQALREYELTRKEEIFVDIWERFENAEQVQHIRNILEKGLCDWPTIANEIVETAYENEPFRNYQADFEYNTIVLHGFYFITPEQQQVFKLLQRANVNIVFLQLYDERFPNSFNFIGDFIHSRFGWVDSEIWYKEKWMNPTVSLADKFLYDFEGIQKECVSSTVTVKKYKNFYDFLEEYEKNVDDNNKTFLAPNASSLNNRLQDYYPEKFQHKRHFLSFPIGQFLFQLHQMWDEDENTLTITENALFECFTSRWIYDEETNKNAHEYTRVLEDLLIFFKDCYRKESWENRAEQLMRILDEVVEPFNKAGDNRFQHKMASPFTSFSQFTHGKEEIHQVVRFIRNIFDIAFELFGDGQQKISLANHFEKLRKFVGTLNPYLEENIVAEEKILVENIRNSLERTPKIASIHVSDISTAISLFLSGKLNKNLDVDVEAIRPFIEIDGEVFKEHAVTHVTGLDENSLPYQEFELPWPLTSALFNALCDTTNPISYMKLRNDHVKEITRYLMYNVLQFSSNLEFSWMVEYDNQKKLDKAVYLSQLQLEPNYVTNQAAPSWQDEKLTIEVTKEELDYFTAYPIDALAEFQFCSRRFYYSYIVSESSYYRNEFVQEFLFGNLLSSVGALLPKTTRDETIKKEVFALFPQWNDLKKETIADENISFKHFVRRQYGNYTKYGESDEFTNMRKLFLFPGLSDKDDETKDVLKLYSEPDQILPSVREEFEYQLEHIPIQLEATPGKKCRFCPHNSICAEAYHPVDDRDRKRGGNG